VLEALRNDVPCPAIAKSFASVAGSMTIGTDLPTVRRESSHGGASMADAAISLR
jgi:hypothetical protein